MILHHHGPLLLRSHFSVVRVSLGPYRTLLLSQHCQGAELVAFVSVNDVFVMRAWEEVQGAAGKVLMLSDGNGDLAAAVSVYPSPYVLSLVCL